MLLIFCGDLLDTISIFKSIVFNVNIDVEYNSLKKSLYQVFGSKEDIVNIFLILLKNSSDAFIKNGIQEKSIKIELIPQGKGIEIFYYDNAGGFEQDDFSKVFDLHESTKKGEGMGIGLYIVKKLIVERYDGVVNTDNFQDGIKIKMLFKRSLLNI